MRSLDEQDKEIVRHLIRDPRASDNAIAEATGMNVRTVGRKRKRLEEERLLSYHAQVDLTSSGTGQFSSRHLYIIKFRIGVTYQQVVREIQADPGLRPEFSRMIYESHLAEMDGKVALLIAVDGMGAADVVQMVHEKLIPVLRESHGADSIEEVSTIRLLSPVRVMRNYLPLVNMENGFIRENWPEEFIYVAE